MTGRGIHTSWTAGVQALAQSARPRINPVAVGAALGGSGDVYRPAARPHALPPNASRRSRVTDARPASPKSKRAS
jgi:hypothetical protein